MSSVAVQEAVESAGSVASHLHGQPSYDLADHPMPTGREEVWRFTPLKRLAGLLHGTASDARLSWQSDVPVGVAVKEISGAEAAALGMLPPTDRPSALAVSLCPTAILVDIPAELELDEPLVVSLTGESIDDIVWGHIVVRVGAGAKATVVFEHTGSARYAATTSVLVGDNAHLDLVSVQLWSDDATHLGHVGMRVGRDARVRSFK